MAQIAEWFQQGGMFMWLVLLLDLPLLLLTMISAAFAIVGSGPVALQISTLAAAVAPGVVGAVGTWYGHRQVDAALAAVAPEHRDEIARVGAEQASLALKFGVGSTLVLVALSGAALAYALSHRES